MRVLLAILHHSVFGGPHNQLLRLAAPLSSQGWETVAVLPEGPGNAADRLRAAGIRVIQVPLRRPRKTLHLKTHADWILGFPAEVALLRRIIREERADVVQVAGSMYAQGAIAAHLERVPVVWQLLSSFAPFLVRCATMPLVLSLSDVVMTTGLTIARLHPGTLRLGRRLVPFYPPVDTHEFRRDSIRRLAAREELGAPSDCTLIGTVGNFNRQKGHDLLVRSASLVRQRFPRAIFRILGTTSPSQSSYYDREVRKLADRTGLVRDDVLKFVEPGNRVSELLPAFDIFVMPSRAEGIPTSILEAMACGLPVIATDVGGISEVVEHGVTGRVVRAGSVPAIADAICDLLANPRLQAQMGMMARHQAVERYDTRICAETHLTAYELAHSAHSRTPGGRAAETERVSEIAR